MNGMIVLVLAALMLFASAPARAVDGDRTGLSFGPRASYFSPKDGDNTWMGGAQLRLFPSNAIGFEGSIDYRREEFGQTNVDVFPVQASLLGYLFPGEPVSVFALGGGGWYFTRIDPPSPAEDDTDHRFGVHAGGGVEIRLNEYWSLDGTYRYIWMEDLSSKDANLLDKDFSDSGSQVTMGLNYYF